MEKGQKLKEKIEEAEKKIVEVAKDCYRLQFHLMPPVGWLNDPNGLCRFKGAYHVFFQYCPLDEVGSMKAWGHYTSKDMLSWDYVGVPLLPDSEMDKDGVYSGSALVVKDKMYLFYTGNVKKRGQYDYDYAGREANIIMVYSEDGLTFSDKKLLLTNMDYPPAYSCHIRDPKVWEENGTYYMLQGGRKKAGKGDIQTDFGTILLFSSKDLQHWQFEKDLTSKERFGYMWECPDFFEVDGQYLFSASPQGLTSEEFRYQNVYQSGYFMLKKSLLETQEIEEDTFQEWDYGFDFYAPQTFRDENGRRILYGWAGIPDAPYDNEPTVERGWQHALTLPREICYKKGKVIQRPVEELKKLRGTEVQFSKQEVLETPAWEILLEDMEEGFFWELSAGEEWLRLSWKDSAFELTLSKEAGRGRISRKVKLEHLEKLCLYADTSLIEIYVNHGEMVMTSRYYFPHLTRKMQVKNCEKISGWPLISKR